MEVELAGGNLVASDCGGRRDQHGSRKGEEKENALVMMGHWGLYLETRRAVLPEVDMTRMAPAFCSMAAATAAMATVSEVGVGRTVMARSSLKRGG